MTDKGVKMGEAIYYGVMEEPLKREGMMLCSQCGADLNRENSVESCGHFDGPAWYQNDYKCGKCGNVMSICGKREKAWW